MSFRNVEQGITAIQAGNLDEGTRLLRIALKDPDVTGGIRAIACLWLAEITTDPQAKRAYYDAALAADPTNTEIRSRVEHWLAAQLPTPPPPTSVPTVTPPPQPPVSVAPQPVFSPTPPQPTTLPGLSPQPFAAAYVPAQPAAGQYRIVGVIGGPNGLGTGFFVSADGLLATTRYVVGGVERVTIELEAGYQVPGLVLRAYPELDLAFVYVQQIAGALMPVTPSPRIPEETPLTATSYRGETVQGYLRTTKRILAPHWFPTTITAPLDAGGSPVFDDSRYLVGMLTRNASASSPNLYGIHISAILTLVAAFKQEMAESKRLYCPVCGYASSAAAAGGYYCEVCGGLMPHAAGERRHWRDAPNLLYHEQNRIACHHCTATVGFHLGKCLRCGRDQT